MWILLFKWYHIHATNSGKTNDHIKQGFARRRTPFIPVIVSSTKLMTYTNSPWLLAQGSGSNIKKMKGILSQS